MKLKIISLFILVTGVFGATMFFHRQTEDKTKNFLCPTASTPFSLNNQTIFEKLPNFTSLAFATPPMKIVQFESELCLMEKPILNKPVMLLYKFKSTNLNPNSIAKIKLPENFVLVSGNPEWQGQLTGDEEQIKIVVKSTKVGYYQLKAFIFREGEEGRVKDSDFNIIDYDPDSNINIIDVEVTSNDAILGSKPENNWYYPTKGRAITVAKNNQAINSQLFISNNPELGKEITVTYRVTPQIEILPPKKIRLDLVFPQRGFKVIKVDFPNDGQTYKNDGALSWEGGNINKNQIIEIVATLRITDTGQGSIYGILNFKESEERDNFTPQSRRIADLYVDKYGGTFTIK